MWVGKTNHLPLFLLFLLSPMLIYFRSILGIGIRFYLSEFAAKILVFTGLPIQVFGNGKMLRDFTYIQDLVQGIVLTISNKKSRNHLNNKIESWTRRD